MWPIASEKKDGAGGSRTSCFAVGWSNSLPITIPGIGTFVGDELRVLAEGGTLVKSLESRSIRASAIDSYRAKAPQRSARGSPSGRHESTSSGAGATSSIDRCRRLQARAAGIPSFPTGKLFGAGWLGTRARADLGLDHTTARRGWRRPSNRVTIPA